MIEIIEGKTPNGGVRAEITYLRDDIPCDKESANKMVIKEISKDGHVVKETWGSIKSKDL